MSGEKNEAIKKLLEKLRFPDKSDLTRWVYEIANYLVENPIVSETTAGDIIQKWLDEHPIAGGEGDVKSVNGVGPDDEGNVDVQLDKITDGTFDTMFAGNADEGGFGYHTPEKGVIGYVYVDADGRVQGYKGDRTIGPVYATAEEAAAAGQKAESARTLAENALSRANAAYSPDNAPPYPVTSVNGMTGAVEISSMFPSQYVRAVVSSDGNLDYRVPDLPGVPYIFSSANTIAKYDSRSSSTLWTAYTDKNPPPFRGLTYAAVFQSWGETYNIPKGKFALVKLTGSELPAGNTLYYTLKTDVNVASKVALRCIASLCPGYTTYEDYDTATVGKALVNSLRAGESDGSIPIIFTIPNITDTDITVTLNEG